MIRHKKTALILLLMLYSLTFSSLQAQTNLLENAGFNDPGSYRAATQFGRGDFAFAPGWDGWQTNTPSTQSWMNIDAIAFPHSGDVKYEGNASQNIGRGDATFTAAAFQVVHDIPEGTTLRASVWVFQQNEPASDARTRIGIGSNVGGNPFGNPITWSGWTRALSSWQQVTIEATVPAGSVTVFVYSTQSAPNDPNQVYYDDAALVVVGEGDVNVGDGDGEPNVPPPPTSTPRQDFAPFVDAQESDVHTVRSGDTLAAISVAYGVPVQEIRDINNLTSDFLTIGQTLVIVEGDAAASPTEEAPSESTAEAETTAEAANVTEEATTAEVDATEEATTAPTEPAADTATPVNSATPSPIPPTPTDAPPAPVAEGAESNPLATEAQVCVLMYNDSNQNRLQDNGDSLLAGGEISLQADGAAEALSHTTDGMTEPHCFNTLAPGLYTASAVAPSGYGLTTSAQLVVNVPPGQSFEIRFGAAEGVEVAVAPTDSAPSIDTEPARVEIPSAADELRNIAGLIVLAVAGVVLLGGVVVAFVMRRK